MPRVPTLNPTPLIAAPRPQIRQQATDAQAFGSELGTGIAEASRTAFGIWREQAASVNEARVLEADTADARHDLEVSARLKDARGSDAPKAFNDAVDERQQYQAKIESTLSNPVQREAFRRSSTQRLLSFENRGSAHVAAETDAYEQQQSQAAVDVGMQQVYASRNDWGEATRVAEETIARRSAFLARRKVPPEEIARQAAALRSHATRSVIDGMISDDNDLGAKKIADQYGGYLTAQDSQAVAGKLKISSTKGEGQRQSAAIWSPDKTLETMLGEADKIEDQGVQAETKDRLVALHTTHARGQEEYKQKTMETAWQIMNTDARGLGAVDKATTEDGTPLIIAMGPARYSALQAAERRRVAGEIADPKKSAELYAHFRSLAVSNPTAFALVDGTKPDADGVSPLVAMTPGDYKEIFGSLQPEVKESGTSGKLMQEAGEEERIVGETLAPLGLNKGAASDPKASPDDRAKVLEFRRQFHAILAKEKADTGKPMATEQAQKIAAKLVATVAAPVPRGWYNPARWVGDSTTTEDAPLFLAIPADEREQIVKAYKAANKGAEPSAADIALRYRLKQEAK